jgi:hypothetical protein
MRFFFKDRVIEEESLYRNMVPVQSRGGSLVLNIIEEKIEGKRGRERSRIHYI